MIYPTGTYTVSLGLCVAVLLCRGLPVTGLDPGQVQLACFPSGKISLPQLIARTKGGCTGDFDGFR